MKRIYIIMVICTLFVTFGCSVLISTPPVAHINMHGLDNQLSEYVVALEIEPTENMIDIHITDRYAINLDFQWLLGDELEPTADPADGYLIEDLQITPWMMCTYRF